MLNVLVRTLSGYAFDRYGTLVQCTVDRNLRYGTPVRCAFGACGTLVTLV